MKNKIVVAMIVALIAAFCVPAAFAQISSCEVRGYVKGEDGKMLAGVYVVYSSEANGRKYTFKTDKNGNYFSISVAPGQYKVSLLDADKKELYPGFWVNATVSPMTQSNVANVDLQKERANQSVTMSEEQKAVLAKNEKAKEENIKIKGLNEKLTHAREQQGQGDFEGAVKTMEEAIAMDTTHDLVWFRLADAYLTAGKKNADKDAAHIEFTKSVDAFKKAIELKPTGAYYNNMGEAYLKLGQTDEAIKSYNQASAVEPENAAQYFFNLGAVLTNIGKPMEANDAFDKAIAADPNRAEAYFQRAINLMSKGSVDSKTGETKYPPEVAAGLQKYLELSPTGQNADVAKTLLTAMGEKVTTSFGPQKSGGKKK